MSVFTCVPFGFFRCFLSRLSFAAFFFPFCRSRFFVPFCRFPSLLSRFVFSRLSCTVYFFPSFFSRFVMSVFFWLVLSFSVFFGPGCHFPFFFVPFCHSRFFWFRFFIIFRLFCPGLSFPVFFLSRSVIIAVLYLNTRYIHLLRVVFVVVFCRFFVCALIPVSPAVLSWSVRFVVVGIV